MARKPTNKMLKSIVENMSEASLGIDRDGKVIICNEVAARLFDSTVDTVVGEKIWNIMEINDFTRNFVSLVKDSEPAPLEQILPLHGDRVFQVRMLPVRSSDDRVVGAVAILKDLTELHKMEITVNEFVSMVSHELKTPLTSIKGFVETLLEGALNNPAITRRFLQVINDETNRMTRLVIDLLDLGHAQRETIAGASFNPINTTEFIRGAVKFFEPVANEKGLTIDSEIPDNLPMIKVDSDKLRQVIINILDNAIKYTSIKNETGSVIIKASVEKDRIKVDVEDSGIGIPAEEVDHIFEKFYRVSKGPASQLGGTGLGLSITREILHSHGGDISVKSELGKGSVFTFVIPLPDKEESLG